ncbi:MAG TPA: hypothetical protein ENN17_01175 [bacterium]|nr:hypothetical protein [bacterium]
MISAATQADRKVDPNRSDACPTINDALRSLPMYPDQRTVILIQDCVYEEKIRMNGVLKSRVGNTVALRNYETGLNYPRKINSKKG